MTIETPNAFLCHDNSRLSMNSPLHAVKALVLSPDAIGDYTMLCWSYGPEALSLHSITPTLQPSNLLNLPLLVTIIVIIIISTIMIMAVSNFSMR